MNTKFARTKEWMKAHKLELYNTGMVVGVVAVYAGMIALAVKQAQKDQDAYDAAQQQLANAAARGASILPSPTGYWIIENQKAS